MGFEDVVKDELNEVELLPRDFYEFLRTVGAVALLLATENPRFYMTAKIAGNIPAVKYYGSAKEHNLVKSPYFGKPSRVCFQMFYEHIQQPYIEIGKKVADITGQNLDDIKPTLGLSLQELKQIDVGREYQGRVVVDDYTTFTRGGFEIKQWRISE